MIRADGIQIRVMETNNAGSKLQMSEKLKQRLYPTVLDLFSNHDFHRVNIREISKRTGVSSGTIYKYFSSKEELIFTILNEQIAQIGIIVSSHIKGMVDIKEIFRKVFWVTMEFYENNPGVAITAFITVPTRTWMQDDSYKRDDNITMLQQHIVDARERGDIDPDLSFRQISDAYYMICYRCIHNWYFAKMEYKLTDQIDDYYYLFWKIMKPQ